MLPPQSSASKTDTYPVISCRGQCVESSILALGTPAALLLQQGSDERTGCKTSGYGRGGWIAGGLCRGGRHAILLGILTTKDANWEEGQQR
ncbi:hypothetical protein GHT06_021140 [Daphnia sinensis]|uniref:Uncharacterized protein n=1 Tax=Daphnia sinensis TaxID=1820382 RepID=A0AAD5PQJ2_9CRUS|nr:hypothetical protein GHT06_021140 [Daphnia sinensis]